MNLRALIFEPPSLRGARGKVDGPIVCLAALVDSAQAAEQVGANSVPRLKLLEACGCQAVELGEGGRRAGDLGQSHRAVAAIAYIQIDPCLTSSCRLQRASANLQNSMNEADRALADDDRALANYAASKGH